jgi:hypothetical protein
MMMMNALPNEIITMILKWVLGNGCYSCRKEYFNLRLVCRFWNDCVYHEILEAAMKCSFNLIERLGRAEYPLFPGACGEKFMYYGIADNQITYDRSGNKFSYAVTEYERRDLSESSIYSMGTVQAVEGYTYICNKTFFRWGFELQPIYRPKTYRCTYLGPIYGVDPETRKTVVLFHEFREILPHWETRGARVSAVKPEAVKDVPKWYEMNVSDVHFGYITEEGKLDTIAREPAYYNLKYICNPLVGGPTRKHRNSRRRTLKANINKFNIVVMRGLRCVSFATCLANGEDPEHLVRKFDAYFDDSDSDEDLFWVPDSD